LAQRYQNGYLRKLQRKSGPQVWEFSWREVDASGRRRKRCTVIGTVEEFKTERDALRETESLRRNINRDTLPSALMKFSDLAEHYQSTELEADNKTEKTRVTYKVYLKKWILPAWGKKYVHAVKPVAVEQWLKSLTLANGSKAKIRNIMSAVFSHAIRYELADRNPITAVRQSAKRQKTPIILDAPEIHRLFNELAIRERAMIVCDALTGIRRGELMGLKWSDVDFIGGQIHIVRSVVDQAIGQPKTEASQKPVPMPECLAQALLCWRQESTYTGPEDWVWASTQMEGKQPLWLSTIMRVYIQPAAVRAGITKKIGWHTFRHTFSTLIKSLGVDAKVVQELLRHASFKTTMDGYTQALDEPKRLAQERLAELLMRTGKVGHA
jgi:integrase